MSSVNLVASRKFWRSGEGTLCDRRVKGKRGSRPAAAVAARIERGYLKRICSAGSTARVNNHSDSRRTGTDGSCLPIADRTYTTALAPVSRSIQDRSTGESFDADPCGSPVMGQRMSILMAKWLKRIPGPTPKVKPTAMMNQCGVFRAAPERWLVLRHHAQCMQGDLLRWQVMRAFPSATDDCLWCVGWQRIHPLSVCQRWREYTLAPFPLSSLRSPPSKPWDLVTFFLDWHLFTVVVQRPQMPFGKKSNGDHPTAADCIGANPPSHSPLHRFHIDNTTEVAPW